jgi:hypothetical protein
MPALQVRGQPEWAQSRSRQLACDQERVRRGKITIITRFIQNICLKTNTPVSAFPSALCAIRAQFRVVEHRLTFLHVACGKQEAAIRPHPPLLKPKLILIVLMLMIMAYNSFSASVLAGFTPPFSFQSHKDIYRDFD